MRSNYAVWGLRGEAIEKPEVIEKIVGRMVGNGFRGVMVRPRDRAYQLDSPELLRAAKLIQQQCLRSGLEFWWNLDPRDAVPNLLAAHPASRQRTLMPVEAGLSGGKWTGALEYPEMSRDDGQSCTYEVEGIERVFAIRRHVEEPIHDDLRDVHFRQIGFLGFTDAVARVEIATDIHDITSSASATTDPTRRLVEVSGQWSPPEPGDWQVLAFVRLVMDTFDYASPDTTDFWRSMIDLYRQELGTEVHGVLSAEPGHPMPYHYFTTRNGFFVGPEFYERFQVACGYDLRERLYALIYETADGSAGKVRHDYYTQWGLTMYRIQKMFKDYAMESFGPHLEVGIHYTASEWAAQDLNKGTMDYFKMAETTTDGFTDGKHHDRFNALFHIILGKSLAKLTERHRAHVQTWDMFSMPSSDDYWTNVISVYGAIWRPLPYGTSWHGVDRMRGELNPQREDNHVTINHKMSLIDDLTGAVPAEANVLMVYPLETFMRIGDESANSVKHALHMATYQLQAANHQVDLIGAEILARAKVIGSHLVLDGREYDAVVYPFPACTREDAWSVLEEFYEKGGRLLLFGTPPSETTAGESLVERFARLVGIKPVTSMRSYVEPDPTTPYRATISFTGSLLGTPTVNIREGFFSHIPWRQYVWPVIPTTGEPVALHIRWVDNETVVGVGNKNEAGGRVLYMGFDCSCLLNGEKLFAALLDDLGVPRLVEGPSGLWLGLARRANSTTVLACRREQAGLFDGEFKGDGTVIKLKGARDVFALTLGPDGTPTDMVAFGLTGIEVDGESLIGLNEPTDVVMRTIDGKREFSLTPSSSSTLSA